MSIVREDNHRNIVSYDEFRRMLLTGQQDIRCCSVMPENDGSAYEYQPEQAVTREEYEAICNAIEASEEALLEDVGVEHVDCSSGACPVDFKSETAFFTKEAKKLVSMRKA